MSGNEPAGMNGNDIAANEAGILNDVWDAAAHSLRLAPANGALRVAKTQAYVATTNTPGDFDGTGNPENLFAVTGQVLMAMIAVCSVALTGASSTIAVGVAGATSQFIPATTCTTIAVNRTVDHTGLVAAGTAPIITPNQVAFDGQTIIGTVGTADITGGTLTYYVFYVPLTAGAKVTAL